MVIDRRNRGKWSRECTGSFWRSDCTSLKKDHSVEPLIAREFKRGYILCLEMENVIENYVVSWCSACQSELLTCQVSSACQSGLFQWQVCTNPWNRHDTVVSKIREYCIYVHIIECSHILCGRGKRLASSPSPLVLISSTVFLWFIWYGWNFENFFNHNFFLYFKQFFYKNILSC